MVKNLPAIISLQLIKINEKKKKKNLPADAENTVPSLGWEDPLEKEMTGHSSLLTWDIPWIKEPGGFQVMGVS